VVSFTAGSGGGLVNGGNATTGADGTASVASWRLGTAIGVNTLVATFANLSVTFSANATVGAPAGITVTPTTLGELLVGDVSQITPRVVDACWNVLANPTVAYSSTNTNVVIVSTIGQVTAVGAGNATVTATAGSVSASATVTVIGHPAGLAITNTINLNFVAPGDVAFTNNAMLIGLGGLNQVMVMDATGTTQTGIVQLTTGAQTVLAPPKAAGPAVVVAPGIPSRLWFIDPAVPALVDSLTISAVIGSTAMKADGTAIYAMLDDGSMSVVDGTTHREITRIALGGGVTKLRVAPGDTTLYALTTVGVVFAVDLRTYAVRQIITNPSNTDFAIGRDGYFYLLDAANSLVRIFDVNTSKVVRTVGVSPGASTIALSPDGKQIWLTHTQGSISIYAGSLSTGFLSAATISTNLSPPIRTYFSPSGSFAAVTNLGGWVDIIR
ncbi:MAG: Ig-like domain-containing protein, partial [Gemmatimonadaceae bacterium]